MKKEASRSRSALDTIVAPQLFSEFLAGFDLAIKHNPNQSILDFHRQFTENTSAKNGLSGFSGDSFWLIHLRGIQAMYFIGALVVPSETLHHCLPEGKKQRVKDLRNAVAHGSFQVESTGLVLYTDRDCSKIKEIVSMAEVLEISQIFIQSLKQIIE